MSVVDTGSRSRVRHRLSFRVVRFALLAALVAELSYVALANAFLNLGGVQAALASQDDIRATFRSAWTLWPGTIHVRNARVLFQDHNVQWSLDADELHVNAAFLPLLSKTLHATRVTGSGVVFRARQRVAAADARSPTTRALPPIPEFETPGLVPAYVPAAPRTDLWTVHAANVDVGVVELWGQQLRYLGEGRARGAFRLHAGHSLWVGPATLALEPGELRVDNRVLSGRFHGHVTCVVHPFLVNVPVGRELFRNFSVELDLHAGDVRLEPLDVFLPDTTFDSPGARLELALQADHGVFTTESQVELYGPELRVSHRDWVFQGGVFEVGAGIAPDGRGEATFRVSEARAAREGAHDSRLKLGRGQLAVASSSVDTAAGWQLVRVDLGLSGLAIPALSGFDDLTRARGVRLRAGSARLDAHGRYSHGAINAEGRAVVSRARGQAGSIGWEVDGSAELSLSEVEIEKLAEGNLDLALAARRLAVIAGTNRLEANNAHVTADARLSKGRGSGRIHTTADELSLGRGKARASGALDASIDLVAFDLSRGALRASATGKLSSLDVGSESGVRGHAGHLGVQSELSLSKGTLPSGWLEITVPWLSVRAGSTAFSLAARASARVKDLDLATPSGTATSELRLRDLEVVQAVGGAKCQSLGIPRAGLRALLGFSPEGQALLNVAGELERAKATWGDFEVSGNAKLASRYRQRSSDLLTLEVTAQQLELKSGNNELEGWDARVPELRVLSKLQRDLGRWSGPVRASAKQVRGRIGQTPVHADLAAGVRFSLLDLDRGEAIGSGDIRLDHAGLVAGGVAVEDWWGRVKLPLLRVLAGDNLDVYGKFDAEFRDGLPALVMFAASDDLPGWLPDLLPLHQLEARGVFQRQCRTSDFYFERASGGPLVAAGRIQTTPRNTRAAFLVQLPPPFTPSVGLVAHDDEVGVSLLVGNDWLEAQSKTLDDWSANVSCKPAADSCSAHETSVE